MIAIWCRVQAVDTLSADYFVGAHLEFIRVICIASDVRIAVFTAVDGEDISVFRVPLLRSGLSYRDLITACAAGRFPPQFDFSKAFFLFKKACDDRFSRSCIRLLDLRYL